MWFGVGVSEKSPKNDEEVNTQGSPQRSMILKKKNLY